MSPWADALAELAEAQNTAFGEPTAFTPKGGAEVRLGADGQPLRAVWGKKLANEVQGPSAADRIPVTISVADLVTAQGAPITPDRGDLVTRDPDGAAERHEVLEADVVDGVWNLQVVANHRPVPTGPRRAR